MTSLRSSPSNPQDQAHHEPSHTSYEHWHSLRPGGWISEPSSPLRLCMWQAPLQLLTPNKGNGKMVATSPAYGPDPNEVCALIQGRQIPTIYGSYDYGIARDLEDCGCAYRDKHDRELGQISVEWTLAHTGQTSVDFMRDLPFDIRFEMGSTRVRLVHG